MFKVRAIKIQTLIMEVMIEFLGLPAGTIVLLARRPTTRMVMVVVCVPYHQDCIENGSKMLLTE